MALSTTNTLLLGFGLALGAVGVGVWAVRGGHGHGRSLHGARTSRRPRQLRGFGGETEQTELKLYIDNDGDLYRGQTTSIIKNLATKLAKGVYDRAKAEKLWLYLTESGAKKYTREFDAPDAKWNNVFSMADRRQVAKELNDDFLQAWKEGSYRNLLPKKYAGGVMAKRAVSVRCGLHTVRGVKLARYPGTRGVFVSVGGRKVGSVVPVGTRRWASSRLSRGGYEDRSQYHSSAISATKSLVCRARVR